MSIFARFALALTLILSFAGPAGAQQYLNLRDADIRAFIEDASRVTGRTMVIDPAVEGTVSIVSERPLSRAQYFEVFLETLRANGLVAVPISGGGLRIAPAADAAREPTRGGGGRFVTRVIPLSQIGAAAAREAVTPLISTNGQVSASVSGNALVVADYEDNLARIRGVLSEIDRDRSAMRLIGLDNAGAREIAAAISDIGRSETGGSPIAVVPVDSSNSVILRGDPARVAQMASIVAQLDSRAALGADVRVHYLEHADAAALLPVLQQIAGQRTSVSTVAPVPTNTASDTNTAPAQPMATGNPGRAVIARYEGTNALIISAPPDVQRTLGEVIRQLDTRREQVLVEALILEVSDNAARELGVQFLLAGTDGTIPFASTNYSNQVVNPLVLGGAIATERLKNDTTVSVDGDVVARSGGTALREPLQQAAAQQLLNVQGGLFGVGGQVGQVIFGAILNAVKTDTASNVLSTPSLMMLDNQPGRILVGQEIPITTGEALSDNFDNAFRTVERQNVGIQLEVTPQINAGGAIKLFIRQEVSSIAGPVTRGSADLILNTREIETVITVDDGDIVAMGGLLDENERRTIEKIPLLGDIPVIGELFTSRSRSKQQTNLIVFIRPRILKDRKDAQAVAAQRYDYMRATHLAHDPDSEPAMDRVLRTYLGTVPPSVIPAELVPTAAPNAAPPAVQQGEGNN
ncbi:type II secretion system secretin GspD [Pacificimonas sp. WHA3]|uniref:Type II secretion system secretin GspD n=1 Tax=Pacificimonas pallii TaxID=2827236 RepID=A0ABS6SHB5_9SPHN|nr:type II secretion system secretin GspD [Pacificimonas pallii]MBV7257809.1 type II secretion system secretin GspD [Pacificimonas pallii]